MKRLHRRFLALLLLLSFLLLSGFTYQEDKQRIYDHAGLFTEEEKAELEQIYQKYSLEDEMDYILLTEDSDQVENSREYAKSFYLEKGFGYNQAGGDGNLLFIDMGNRRVEMIDKGKCVDYVRDEEVEEILDEVAPHLSDGNYMEAARSYADCTHSAFVTEYESGSKGNGMLRYLIYGVLALVTAGVVTGSLVRKNKSRMTADCYTYGKEIKVDPYTKKDRYLHTQTTAVPKPKHDSDGGGGSVDSGGFGGGGRDF